MDECITCTSVSSAFNSLCNLTPVSFTFLFLHSDSDHLEVDHENESE